MKGWFQNMDGKSGNDLRGLITMCSADYQDMVSVACYAIEHGFEVRYAGDGNLIIRLTPKQNGSEN